MALPHFHGGTLAPEPIYSNLYDCLFISNLKEHEVPVEKVNLDGLVLNCDIQDMPDIGWDIIKNANFLILNQYDRRGFIIKVETFEVKNINLFTSLSWDSQGLSYIKASYDVINTRSFIGDNIDSDIKQFKRDLKLNSILN